MITLSQMTAFSTVRTLVATHTLTKALLLSLVIAMAAKVAIPFWPVPMTLHAFAVTTIALTATRTVALASVIAYLAAIAIGLPVGASGAGLAYFAGPTGGYLIGFLPMVWVMGALKNTRMNITELFFVSLAGQAVLYTCGVAWLSTGLGLTGAIAAGLVPFLLHIPASIAFALFTKHILGQIKNKAQ